ncbi:unnamed protein product [Acanthoscelides obtectus]|uniref:Uncharacterized protein n=1 Tax=Acanthoscelides obtectus TaxID=200917 RepID=A0A9P0PE41_ACAOB|nr:unnamed protein product [Acanthoscelides obtectus]CAK1626178.1 hypothetical protein AOBTE_LOCUS3666 [Acanthoscelides obtectus]
MAEPGYVSICDLDFTDLTLYQHPPCMFTLWWLGIFVNAIWDPIKEAIEHILKSEGGGDGEEGDEEVVADDEVVGDDEVDGDDEIDGDEEQEGGEEAGGAEKAGGEEEEEEEG